MFKKVDDKLILEINGIIYEFLNNTDDYKKIVILLTNPKDEVDINLDMDADLSEEEIQICKNYKEFIEEFLEKRKEYLEYKDSYSEAETNTYVTTDFDELPF